MFKTAVGLLPDKGTSVKSRHSGKLLCSTLLSLTIAHAYEHDFRGSISASALLKSRSRKFYDPKDADCGAILDAEREERLSPCERDKLRSAR